MLFLLFQLGPALYALEAAQVAEVLPLLSLKPVPHAPRGVAGIFNFRGTPVPALDLSDLTLGRPAAARLSTRIILVNYPGQDGATHLLGLVAEKATETLRREPGDFLPTGITSREAPFLGPVADDPRGFIQWIKVEHLLPAEVSDALFKPQPAESAP